MKSFNNNNLQKISLLKSQQTLLKFLASGMTLEAIADKLGVKYNTVKSRTKCLYEKFEVKNRNELIGKAISFKLLTTKDVKNLFRKRFKPQITSTQKPQSYYPLNEKELQYLTLASKALPVREIIKEMKLTGRYHAQYFNKVICIKLGARNIFEAVLFALSFELIEISPEKTEENNL